MQPITKKFIDSLTYEIIGAAIEVHKNLGPGLMENIYETCLDFELERRGLKVVRQQTVPLNYKSIMLDAVLRLDLLVEDSIIVEIKAVENLHPVYEAQILTYMSLLQKPKGILLNFFSVNIFKNGQKTFVNNHFTCLPEH